MFYSTLLLAATTFTGLVSAQNYSTSGPISVVPDSVSITLRESWCRAQTGSCPQICGGQANPNTCDPVSTHMKTNSTDSNLTNANIILFGRTPCNTNVLALAALNRTFPVTTQPSPRSFAHNGKPIAFSPILTIWTARLAACPSFAVQRTRQTPPMRKVALAECHRLRGLLCLQWHLQPQPQPQLDLPAPPVLLRQPPLHPQQLPPAEP